VATESFPIDPDGYRRLLDWSCSHGELVAVGMAGTGAYGSQLARFLCANPVAAIDVDRPDRRAGILRSFHPQFAGERPWFGSALV
jgi:transposase